VEVRSCSERDLELVRERWPTPDDLAGAHYRQHRPGVATYLIGWIGDEPLGCALVQWRGCVGERARAAFPSCVEVNHLHVRPEYRGRGAGTAILRTAEQFVRDAGIAEIALSVSVTNEDAARLYRRLGYLATGVIDVCSYTWFDERGASHDETESSELLLKRL
jgi:ribosomal protein S18 acetylase RimI-like enzyme